MAYREFTDDQGVLWTAWDTYPETSQRVGLGAFQEGWLTFQHAHERRRLIPVPEGWADAPERALCDWVRDAVAATSRPQTRIPAAPAPPSEVAPSPPAETRGRLPRVSDDVRTLIERSRETLENVERAISSERDPMAAGSSGDAAGPKRRKVDAKG